MSDATLHAALLAQGQVLNHYQPIVNLQSGRLLGVEVLGRLVHGATIIPPGVFLPDLSEDQLEELLFVSLSQGFEALAVCAAMQPDLFMSFNVSPSVMLRSRFVTTLLALLTLEAVDPRQIVLEILEDDDFLSIPAAQGVLEELHAAGIRIALDDVGVGYSSLSRLRELKVDKIKLDQSFVRELQRKPEGLHFVSAMQSLSRGLHAELVVEGVETAQILSALGVMGVQAAQGYGIARPMPLPALIAWVSQRKAEPVARMPCNLLGAYAAHLSIVEACRSLMNQPLRFAWADDIRDPHACCIGRYFDDNDMHETPYGLAHKRFHALFDRYDEDPVAWEQATADLWSTMQEAVKAQCSDAPDTVYAARGPAAPPAAPENETPAQVSPSGPVFQPPAICGQLALADACCDEIAMP